MGRRASVRRPLTIAQTAKELARPLVGTDSCISKRLVNSVLSLEGAAAVSYDRAAFTYNLRPGIAGSR